MRNRLLLFFLILASCVPGTLYAQAWSGVIAPTRAVDWSTAGVVGGIPSYPACTTAQAGRTVPIAAYSGSGAIINTALANCAAANPNGSYLQLAAGTFNINTVGMQFAGLNNVVLRGMGADQTIMVFSAGAPCNGYGALACISPPWSTPGGSEGNVCDYTAGYAVGATTITLANCGSTTPAKGSVSNLKVGGIITLDQVDYLVDPGTIWSCLSSVSTNPCSQSDNGGGARTNGPCLNTICNRAQQQVVRVTQCDGNGTIGHTCASGTNITISPGLYLSYNGTQLPQAYFPQTSLMGVGNGLENLSVSPILTCDSFGSNPGTGSLPCNVAEQNLTIASAYNCWIKGVRSLYGNRSHVLPAWSMHITIQDNYMAFSVFAGSTSYGIETRHLENSLIQNNIMQQITDSTPTMLGEGTVVAYNFGIYTTYDKGGGWFQANFYMHHGGDAFNLWEGNIGSGVNADSIHGTHHFGTFFRNYLPGWQRICGPAEQAACNNQTNAIDLAAGSRYFNLIGNVLGTPSFHTHYDCLALSTASCTDVQHTIYSIGYTGNAGGPYQGNPLKYCTTPSCTAMDNYDPETVNYLMRWGNWDVVNGTAQWNTGEVPSSISPYGNPVPPSHMLPASFYVSAKPSWWGSLPWPGIGPDVSNGNIGQCSGGTYARVPAINSSQCTPGGGSRVAALGGTANANAAMNCAFNVMNMPVDGSGNALSFNAASCYGGAPPPPPPPSGTAPPTSLSLIVQ